MSEDAKVLRLSITDVCPLNCPFCYASKSNRTLKKDVIKEIIREAFDDGYMHVAIGGGEPLCVLPELTEAIEVAKHFGMNVAITTSGFGLTKEKLKRLKKCGVDIIHLSLGAYRENNIEAYRLLTQHEVRFGINLLISPKLIAKLIAILKRFEEDGAYQTTILLPKMGAPRLSIDAFINYLEKLKVIENEIKSMQVYIDCLTNRILTGKCYPQGCSFFTDLTVSRCAFGAPKAKWNGDLTKAVDEANRAFSDCPLVKTSERIK
jgi:MoaA/NifB/PqqE/SkfB family radical SAM enzyme